MSQIRVAVLHSKPLGCEGIAHVLRGAGFSVFATATSLQALLDAAHDTGKNAVIVVWGTLFTESMADAVSSIKAAFPEAGIFILADQSTDGQGMREAHAAGASGFLTTDASPEVLVEYIRLVALGIRAFPAPLPDISAGNGQRNPPAKPERVHRHFSERENDILQFLAAGHSNKTIARKLSITESTVKAHVRSILRKLGASNRT